jgi:hypothetical protein
VFSSGRLVYRKDPIFFFKKMTRDNLSWSGDRFRLNKSIGKHGTMPSCVVRAIDLYGEMNQSETFATLPFPDIFDEPLTFRITL